LVPPCRRLAPGGRAYLRRPVTGRAVLRTGPPSFGSRFLGLWSAVCVVRKAHPLRGLLRLIERVSGTFWRCLSLRCSVAARREKARDILQGLRGCIYRGWQLVRCLARRSDRNSPWLTVGRQGVPRPP